MKKTNIPLFVCILITLVFSTSSALATYAIVSSSVIYQPEDNSWAVTEVESALNELYDKTEFGDATSEDIKSGKSALVQGQPVLGNFSCPSCDYSNYVNKANIANLSGTKSVSAGSSSTTLNGYYNMSNYKVQCASCPSCPACNNGSGSYWNSGSFTSSTSSTTKIVTGFRPSYITIVGNNLSSAQVNVYNSSVSTSKAYNNSAGWQNIPVSSRANIYSIDSDGFTVAKDTSVHTLYWFAIR